MLLVLANEVAPDKRYHVEALRRHLPDHEVYEFAARGGQPALDGVDGVVISGSTAGVYEADEYPWMNDQKVLIRKLVEERIPTLGVCFGHQIVNDALGGTVEHRGLRASLVDADLTADPLFDGVSSVLPAAHGDVVTGAGDGLEPIASLPDYPLFATRHRDAPLWTVQYHPEFTADLLDRLRADFGWAATEHSFADVTAPRTYRNFAQLAAGY
ncbi:type 1 glutamine amidotransferase [Haloarculaceae archaeon H-GB2-1]|nr:type 1 glutamine amidotransferase [Haloarculaceae archaeon H-GB1-1]MEA5387629.1 type 1 glutamine amidotransferase [Haloarculaceae archaeon H-GB11]MEA5409116.1 type 1 glutamine amidotransferase [Haloarculaceae archaeon H-GB2-1]